MCVVQSPGFEPAKGKKIFSFPKRPGGLRIFFLWVKRPGRAVNRSPPSSVTLRMSGVIPPHKKENVIRERACRIVLFCASQEIYLNFLLAVNNPVS